MTKEVLIRISGFQMLEGESDNVEVITAGDYYHKNGKHYIIYDEVMDSLGGSVRNTVKISPVSMDIRKNGVASAHMVFEQNKKNMTRYATPMGDMMVEISTDSIKIKEEEDRLQVSVDYSLDINYERISQCNIIMDVYSKEKANLSLSGQPNKT